MIEMSTLTGEEKFNSVSFTNEEFNAYLLKIFFIYLYLRVFIIDY